MLGELMVFMVAVAAVAVVGYLLHEHLPDIVLCYKIKASERAVRQAVQLERPSWADHGQAHVSVFTSHDGVMGCTVSATFTLGKERVEHVHRTINFH